MAKNTLIHPIDELRFGTYDPKDASQALKITEKLAWERIDRILHLDPKDRTFENTVLALTRSTDEFDAVVSIIGHLESVLGEPWRKADILSSTVASKFYNEINLHTGLYKAFKEVDSRLKIKELTKAQNKLLTDMIREYKRGGVDLPPAEKERLKEINKELSRSSTKFSQNTVKANDKTGICVTNKADLDGLSDEFIKEAAENAKIKGKTAGYWVSFNEPNFMSVMSLCTVASTRKAMFKAVKTTGLSPNLPLAKKILELRYEKAKLLGYKTYADFVLKSRMAKNGKTARTFIDNLTKTYKPIIKRELRNLENFARKYENNPKYKLDASDIDSGLDWFYAHKQREKLFDINESVAKEYFPIEKVLSGMFETLSILYGVKFIKNSSIKRWHKDVEIYEIHDELGKHIATVWCDWFARKNKQGNAWMNAYYVADRADGKVDKPHLGYVIANLPLPTKTVPSLLKPRDVETIWHEFGHFMHLALGRTELVEQSMMDIEWDFVEAPSQIFENWIWQPEILTKITSHYKTEKKIPDSLVKKLIAARQFRASSKNASQFIYAKTDLMLHMDYAKDPSKADPVAVNHKNKLAVRGYPAEEWDKGALSFNHIFAGGYAAAYYSYKWAEAIEADFFERFQKEGVLNSKLGREYRDKVLARGAEIPATTLVKDFLGRQSNIKAMLRRDGIKP